jgi:hypothetical protein
LIYYNKVRKLIQGIFIHVRIQNAAMVGAVSCSGIIGRRMTDSPACVTRSHYNLDISWYLLSWQPWVFVDNFKAPAPAHFSETPDLQT